MTQPSPTRMARRGRPAFSRAADVAARRLIALSGWVAILILAGIFVFLALNATKAIREIGLARMLAGTDWFPTSDPPSFGFLPSEVGSIWVTLRRAPDVGPGGHRCRGLPL